METDVKIALIAMGIILAAIIVGAVSESQEAIGAAVGSNIRQAAPTPTSCTPQQNCGSPTCGIASGRGSGCGCGG